MSNAVKYTSSGSISIRCDGDRLVISDTVIGIAAEDLPRIFDKGYTGFNGRADRKASGIGPVSYTHLDVYKRQAGDNPEEGGDDVKSSCPL